MTDTQNTRISALEERLAHQDQAIEDLNETITEQWKSIDALKRDLSRLTDDMRELEQSGASPAGKEPPPPHY